MRNLQTVAPATSAQTPPMTISMSGLSKVYRGHIQALRNVDLTIEQGMVGLLGPNGAGKTTLMRILAGILRPTSGTLTIAGIDASRSSSDRNRTQIKRLLGYLPQELGMYPDLSAREFLDYIALLKGMDNKQQRQARVEQLLETVALSEVANRKLKTYSGGMKRRVGIAQALLNDPRLLIVDEPTAGLDPEERIRFRNLLSELGGNRIVLLSTHIVEDVAQTCQRLAVLANGQVRFQGTLGELVAAAQGKVWLLTLPAGGRPLGDGNGELSVIATQHLGAQVQYRVVSEREPQAPTRDGQVASIEPSLEDAYVYLMREQR